MKFIFCLMAVVPFYTIFAADKAKTPHTKITIRPGPPVKPTQPAKPVGNQKSDWGGKEKS